MSVILNGGRPLLVGGQVALAQNCCCEDPWPCGGCTNAPAYVTLTVSGIGNGTCAACTAMNGTFVLNFNLALSCPILGPPPLCGDCYYTYALGLCSGAFVRHQVRLQFFTGPDRTRVEWTVPTSAISGAIDVNGVQCHQVGTATFMGGVSAGLCAGSSSISVEVVVP